MLYHHSLLDPLIDLANKKTAILFTPEQTFTADALWEGAQTLATQLNRLGMQQDDRVVLALGAGPDFLRVMYACILLRVKVAIIDPEMGRELYAAKLKQLDLKWAFVDSRLLLLQEHPIARFLYFKLSKKAVYFPRHKGLIIIAMGKRMPLLQSVSWFNRLVKAAVEKAQIQQTKQDHDFLIVYTSGTLQEPKGVLLSLDALAASIDRLVQVLQARPEDRIGTYLPHFLLLGIASAVPVYSFDPNWDVQKKLHFFSEQKISILFGPPSDFLPLIKRCEVSGTTLPAEFRHILLGSAPVHPSFLKRLFQVCPPATRISCTYGMTENLLVSVIDGKEKMNYSGEGDPVGIPVPGLDLKIAEDGEILLRSPQLYSRYFHQADRAAYHATGDLGYVDEKGNLFLKGRKKEMIIRGNTNIYPALYETTIKKIEGIDEAAMVGIYNEQKQDEEVYLAVEGKESLSEKAILEQLAYGTFQIDTEALPDKVVFMQIPRKGRQNKIDRAEIVRKIQRSS